MLTLPLTSQEVFRLASSRVSHYSQFEGARVNVRLLYLFTAAQGLCVSSRLRLVRAHRRSYTCVCVRFSLSTSCSVGAVMEI